jgi:DHA1 family bicyclomycin/chloramphenicol resistance-like MFS transporter
VGIQSDAVSAELRFPMADGIELVADAWGEPEAPPALLLHGGGQTRHAWKRTAATLARHGYYAVAIDQRGHGDSGRSPDGNYEIDRFAGDVRRLATRFARAPVLIGASLGGIASLIAAGEAAASIAAALVLVDITPRVDPAGVDRIRGFMAAHVEDGFATLEEAADAIAAYLPHRPRPQSLDGLAKNLRRGTDGRYRWHYDPAFVRGIAAANRRRPRGAPHRRGATIAHSRAAGPRRRERARVGGHRARVRGHDAERPLCRSAWCHPYGRGRPERSVHQPGHGVPDRPAALVNAPAPRPHGALLAAIACSGTLAMHMLVPALPAVARDLDTTPFAAQLTLSVYLIGIAAGPLIYGPLSDRFGRRPVLIVSLAVFLAASLMAALAPSIQSLIAARVMQAVGACGGLVLGRAMARDGAKPDEAARRLALLVMVMTAAPALAPLLGATVASLLGWRAIFDLLGTAAAVLLLLTIILLPETNQRRAPLPGARALLTVYGELLRRPEFRAYAIGGACMSTSFYAFLSASPFLFTEVLHRPPSEVGIYYLVVVAGITAGSWLSSRLTVRLGMDALLSIGAGLGIAGAAGLLVVDLTQTLSVQSVLAPMSVFALGCGMTSPVATARAIGVDPQRIGAAAGLYGCLQMGFGALCTSLAGLWHAGSAVPIATILLVSATTSQIALFQARRLARQRRGDGNWLTRRVAHPN